MHAVQFGLHQCLVYDAFQICHVLITRGTGQPTPIGAAISDLVSVGIDHGPLLEIGNLFQKGFVDNGRQLQVTQNAYPVAVAQLDKGRRLFHFLDARLDAEALEKAGGHHIDPQLCQLGDDLFGMHALIVLRIPPRIPDTYRPRVATLAAVMRHGLPQSPHPAQFTRLNPFRDLTVQLVFH